MLGEHARGSIATTTYATICYSICAVVLGARLPGRRAGPDRLPGADVAGDRGDDRRAATARPHPHQLRPAPRPADHRRRAAPARGARGARCSPGSCWTSCRRRRRCPGSRCCSPAWRSWRGWRRTPAPRPAVSPRTAARSSPPRRSARRGRRPSPTRPRRRAAVTVQLSSDGRCISDALTDRVRRRAVARQQPDATSQTPRPSAAEPVAGSSATPSARHEHPDVRRRAARRPRRTRRRCRPAAPAGVGAARPRRPARTDRIRELQAAAGHARRPGRRSRPRSGRPRPAAAPGPAPGRRSAVPPVSVARPSPVTVDRQQPGAALLHAPCPGRTRPRAHWVTARADAGVAGERQLRRRA